MKILENNTTQFIVLSLFLTFCVYSCGVKKPIEKIKYLSENDTLYIATEFSDCGEWGGHRETLSLINKRGIINARLLIDEVPCDDVIEKNGVSILNPEKRKIIIDKSKALKTNDIRRINNFIQSLMDLKSKEITIAHYGTNYVVMNTSGSFKFDFWNGADAQKTNYEEFRNQIFGE